MKQSDLLTLDLDFGIANEAEIQNTEDLPVFYEHNQHKIIALANIKGKQVELTVFEDGHKEKINELKAFIRAYLVAIKLESNGFRITKARAIGISIAARDYTPLAIVQKLY